MQATKTRVTVPGSHLVTLPALKSGTVFVKPAAMLKPGGNNVDKMYLDALEANPRTKKILDKMEKSGVIQIFRGTPKQLQVEVAKEEGPEVPDSLVGYADTAAIDFISKETNIATLRKWAANRSDRRVNVREAARERANELDDQSEE